MDSIRENVNMNWQANSQERKNYNEYSFRWGKKFGFLILKTMDSKLNINPTLLNIEMNPYYLGFIKGKSTTKDIPLGDVMQLEMKKLLHPTDLIIAAIFFLGGFLNPLFFAVAALSVWACINTHIILKTISGEIIKIPSYSRKEAKEFIDYYRDIFTD